jgi:hypothetical protein
MLMKIFFYRSTVQFIWSKLVQKLLRNKQKTYMKRAIFSDMCARHYKNYVVYPPYVIYFLFRQNFLLTVEWSWFQQDTGLATVLLVPIGATDPVCLIPTVYSFRNCFGRVRVNVALVKNRIFLGFRSKGTGPHWKLFLDRASSLPI